MITLTDFRTPEETALQLELLLLATLTDSAPSDGPIEVAPVHDDRQIRQLRRAVERLNEIADEGEETVGIVGAVAPARRAQVSAMLAASMATRRAVTLLDADLRAALLSFDSRAYAQEGLVDVIRYGVRSPRVVAPTQVAGLSLLPVGSGTVDLAGTWGADSFEPLLRELARTGDLLVVNAPGTEDLGDAENLVDRISHWILLHEIGSSDAETTRAIRDYIGSDRLLGVLVLHPAQQVPTAVPAPSAGTELLDTEAPVTDATIDPELEPVSAWSDERAQDDADRAEPTQLIESKSTMPDWEIPKPAPRSANRALWIGIAAALVAALLLIPRLLSQKPDPRVTRPTESTIIARETPTVSSAGETPTTVDPSSALAPSSGAAVVDDVAGGTTPPVSPTEGGSTITAGKTVPGAETKTTPPVDQGTGGARPPVDPAPVVQKEVAPPVVAQTPSKSATPPPQPKSTESIAATPSGSFAVHVASLQTRNSAETEAGRYRAAGLPIVIRRVDLGEKGIWHRVFVGPYATRNEATEAASGIRSQGLSDYTQVQRVSGTRSSR